MSDLHYVSFIKIYFRNTLLEICLEKFAIDTLNAYILRLTS